MLYDPKSVKTTVTGINLARGHRSPSRRAAVAAQLVLGEIEIIKPTLKQACGMTGANREYARKLLHADHSVRLNVEAGVISITDAFPTDDELLHLAREVGVERLWQAICAVIE
jgi:hypothetical protein